jgi:uncharacterized Zn finger protein
MEVTFECRRGHSSVSEIETMISEKKSHYIVTCRCNYCGRLNRVKIKKDYLPNQHTDISPFKNETSAKS